MGMSGVSRFGTDIGGYNTYGPAERLTPELLVRWIQFGAVSGVMRTKRSGLAFPSYTRPQVFDKEILPVWRRYTKLHTQLYPYILGADAHYRSTGMPLMRHLALAAPGDTRALRGGRPAHVRRRPAGRAGARAGREGAQAVRARRASGWTGGGVSRSTAATARSTRARRAGCGALPSTRSRRRSRSCRFCVRAGSVLPMLSADVDTLAPYGDGLVHLEDREDRLTLLAFPRGRWLGRMFERGRLSSSEGRRRRAWTLGVKDTRRRTYTVEASLRTLRRPFRPCRVTVAGRPLSRRRWSYERSTGVLRARFGARRARLVVRPCR